jgi:hypothetical protein
MEGDDVTVSEDWEGEQSIQWGGNHAVNVSLEVRELRDHPEKLLARFLRLQ